MTEDTPKFQGKEVEFGDKYVAAQLLKLSPKTIAKYRKDQDWIEGLHYEKVSPRVFRYNLTLIEDWMHKRSTPHKHMNTLYSYLREQETEARKRKREAKKKKA